MDISQHVRFELRFHKRETEFPTFVCNAKHKHHHRASPSSGLFYPVSGCIANGNCPTYTTRETLYLKHSDGRVYTAVTYCFFYQTNPAIGCGYCCFPRAKCLGYHDIDLERVTVLYHHMPKLNIYTPSYVYFHAHGKGQGVWKRYMDCELVSRPDLVEVGPDDDDIQTKSAQSSLCPKPPKRHAAVTSGTSKAQHIVVYVARGSHASYPEYGLYPRIFGLANDVCQHFHTSQVDQYIPFDASDPDWMKLRKNEESVQVITETSITPMKRFLLPLWSLLPKKQ